MLRITITAVILAIGWVTIYDLKHTRKLQYTEAPKTDKISEKAPESGPFPTEAFEVVTPTVVKTVPYTPAIQSIFPEQHVDVADHKNEYKTELHIKRKEPKRDVCEIHKLRKVFYDQGRRWKCE